MQSSFLGGSIDNDLFGVFEVIDSLQLTNVSPDFSSGESVGFPNSPNRWSGICSSQVWNPETERPSRLFLQSCLLSKLSGMGIATMFRFSWRRPAKSD